MVQPGNLDDMVNTINTQADFVAFVKALAQDLQENPLDWENDSLERYFEAMATWSQDMNGYFKNINQPLPKDINWKIMGQILLAAKTYE